MDRRLHSRGVTLVELLVVLVLLGLAAGLTLPALLRSNHPRAPEVTRLIPDPTYRRKMYDQVWASFSEKDLEAARRQTGKGRTLKEILADLEARFGTAHRAVEADTPIEIEHIDHS